MIFVSGCVSSDSISDYMEEIQPYIEDIVTDDIHEETRPETPIPTINGNLLTVHFIDVGQGDSILIQINDKNMLIDAGDNRAGDTVVSYLEDNDVEDLDFVIATHPHADHIGGMVDVIDNFNVMRFIDSGNPHTTRTYENMLIAIDENDIPFSLAESGQTIDLDPSVTIEVLNPVEPTGNLNDDSIVLKLTYGEVSFLFTGDAERRAENRMIDEGYDIDSDILKVGHHGSSSSTIQEFLDSVSPEVCIIMVGTDNRYGHPHEEVIDRLNLFGCEIYRTDLDGNIIVKTDGRDYSVETQSSGLVIPMTAMIFALTAEA